MLANMTEPDLIPFLWRCGVRGFLRYRTRWTRYPRWIANALMLRRPRAPDYATGHAIENNLAMARRSEWNRRPIGCRFPICAPSRRRAKISFSSIPALRAR